MESRSGRTGRLVFSIALGVLIPLVVFLFVLLNDMIRPLWLITGKVVDNGTFSVYLPDGLERGKKYPLVFALSPNADAVTMLALWSPVAEKHKWIIAGSKEFRNGQDFDPSMQQIESELNGVETKYPVDDTTVIFTGMSGGGMGSHAFVKYHSDQVKAIVINTGMMADGSKTPDYPAGKAAVFLASPTDFRYHEMISDRQFLQYRHWKTKWIEFAGGHTLAPEAVYEEAAQWLEANIPSED